MIRFVWVNLVIGVATMACGLAAIVAAVFRVRGRFYYWATRSWARATIWASDTPVRTQGLEKVNWAEPHVLISNHVSFWDIFAIAAVLPEPFHFVGKKELNRIPFFGLAWRAAGHISIDRTNRASAVASLRKAGEKIRREKGTVIMFPEGTRSRGGGLQPFKKGAFLLAVEAGVPIVPAVVRGSDRVAPGGMRIVPHPIEVRFGDPIPTAGPEAEQGEALVDTVRARMLELLAAPDASALPRG